MCFVIYPAESEQQIGLRFVQERILLCTRGGFHVEADVLVENMCDEPISTLRLLLPYSLVDCTRVTSIKSEEKSEKILRELREIQLGRVQLLTSRLSSSTDESNWIYNLTLAHVDIDTRSNEGTFCLKRYHPEEAFEMEPVQGFLKSDWRIKHPNVLNDKAWGLLNLCEITVLDIVRIGNPQENLNSGEKMWLRLSMDVPTSMANKWTVWTHLIRSGREYRQEFHTPQIIATDTIRHLEQLKIEEHFNPNLAHQFNLARRPAKDVLPNLEKMPEISDWRSFLYHEKSLAIASQKATGVREKEDEYTLPARPLWRRIMRIRGTTRADTAVEVFFGKELEEESDGAPCGSMIVKASYTNQLRDYIIWINLLIGIVAVVMASLALLRD